MALNVRKEAETAGLKVTKSGLSNYKFNVEHYVDVSGSMQPTFSNGLMDEVMQRVMSLASVVDPDGLVRFVAFSDRAKDCGDFSTKNFDTITDDFLRAARDVLWSGTDYASPFKVRNQSIAAKAVGSVVSKFKGLFGSKPVAPTKVPRLVIITTDGDNQSGSDTEFMNELQKAIADNDTFVMLLGVGHSDFSLLEEADEKFFGVDFVDAANIKSLNNEEFYDKMLSPEFVSWMKKVS